jgi:hypothetical protein
MTPSAAPLVSSASVATIAVPEDTWYVIEAARIDLACCTTAYWVERLQDINAYGVQLWKKAKRAGEPGTLSLLFKSVQARDMTLRQFKANPPPGCNRHHIEALTLTGPEAGCAAHVSNLDLEYVNQAYAHKPQFFPGILSLAPPAYRKATAANHFFDSERYPPILATPSERCPKLNDPARKRPMRMMTFSLDWAEMQGAVHPKLSSSLHYHRLLTLMRAQVHRQGKKDIRIHVWPTDSPYEEILRILARLACEVFGSTVTPPLLDETFGYTSHQWVMKVELALDRPRFKKHPDDVYDQERF